MCSSDLFSPIGDPIKIRTRRFPALVNCVVIDWFQPWPEDALYSVSKRFLDGDDLGTDETKLSVIGFMPYSFLAVEKVSARASCVRATSARALHTARRRSKGHQSLTVRRTAAEL